MQKVRDEHASRHTITGDASPANRSVVDRSTRFRYACFFTTTERDLRSSHEDFFGGRQPPAVARYPNETTCVFSIRCVRTVPHGDGDQTSGPPLDCQMPDRPSSGLDDVPQSRQPRYLMVRTVIHSPTHLALTLGRLPHDLRFLGICPNVPGETLTARRQPPGSML